MTEVHICWFPVRLSVILLNQIGGLRQVQSAINDRITANFEQWGKQLINAAVISLIIVTDEGEKYNCA